MKEKEFEKENIELKKNLKRKIRKVKQLNKILKEVKEADIINYNDYEKQIEELKGKIKIMEEKREEHLKYEKIRREQAFNEIGKLKDKLRGKINKMKKKEFENHKPETTKTPASMVNHSVRRRRSANRNRMDKNSGSPSGAFVLDEKIWDSEDAKMAQVGDVSSVKNIKEFLRIIKEDFRQEKDDNENLNFNRVINILKKRAGKKLTGK